MSTSDISKTDSATRPTDAVDEAKDELSQVSRESADAAREVAESRYEQGRTAATDQLDSASDAMSEVAIKLEDSDSPFASYAAELSDQLSSFSSKLSTSSIDDLAGGARTLARENPAAFMLGSMAIGLAASRFFKATGEQVSHRTSPAAASTGNGHVGPDAAQRQGYDMSGTREQVTEHDSAHSGLSVPGNTGTERPPVDGVSVGQSGSHNINQQGTLCTEDELKAREEA